MGSVAHHRRNATDDTDDSAPLAESSGGTEAETTRAERLLTVAPREAARAARRVLRLWKSDGPIPRD